jgi:hypothetical protein
MKDMAEVIKALELWTWPISTFNVQFTYKQHDDGFHCWFRSHNWESDFAIIFGAAFTLEDFTPELLRQFLADQFLEHVACCIFEGPYWPEGSELPPDDDDEEDEPVTIEDLASKREKSN